MRCAPSSALLILTFSVAIQKASTMRPFPRFGTVIREVCNFYGFLCVPTKPMNKRLPLEGGNWIVESRSGKETFFTV